MHIGYTAKPTEPVKVELTGTVVGRALEELLFWVVLVGLGIGICLLVGRVRQWLRAKGSGSDSPA